MTDVELKLKISNYYTQFDLFIKALDTTKSKNSLDEEIQRRYDSYHNPIISLINSSLPLDNSYNAYCKNMYFLLVSGEFKKFKTLWKEFLDSVQ